VSGRNPTRPEDNHTLYKQSSIKQHYQIKNSAPSRTPYETAFYRNHPQPPLHQRHPVPRSSLPQTPSSNNESVIKWGWKWRFHDDIFILGDKSKEFCWNLSETLPVFFLVFRRLYYGQTNGCELRYWAEHQHFAVRKTVSVAQNLKVPWGTVTACWVGRISQEFNK